MTNTNIGDFSSLFRWKGALFRIQYRNYDSEDLTILNQTDVKKTELSILSFESFPTLKECCCKVLVSDALLAKYASSLLPSELHYHMMKKALEKKRDRSVNVLLQVWPAASLTLRTLLPQIFCTSSVLYDDLVYRSQIQHAILCTTSLIRSLMCIVEHPDILSVGKLKMLDLRCFPTVDFMVQYISRFLLSKTSNSSFSKSRKRHWSPSSISHAQNNYLDKVSRDESFILSFDAVVRGSETCDLLCKALSISKNSHSPLKLQINQLDVSNVRDKELEALLKHVDHENLTGLSLQYNSLLPSGISFLAPQISMLKNLSALDLSCNNINLTENPDVRDVVTGMLSSLCNLKRLDFSNNRVGNCLRELLCTKDRKFASSSSNGSTGFPLSLEYLKLSACRLTQSDLLYISTSNHRFTLRELDLCENVLFIYMSSLIQLLEATQNLEVLELEGCGFKDDHFLPLIKAISSLKKLWYLNLAGHEVTTKQLYSSIPLLAGLPHLECVRITYPNECYDSNDQEICVNMKASVEIKLKELFSKTVSSCRRNPMSRMVHIVWTDDYYQELLQVVFIP
ncbi:leucine-rich repeat-containing protein 14-like isoform X1 [Tachypleus tridentatus]|uniref:leucine-rich repeat-containing protein 14-like isoform X1 n=3 Tax=Tachypleus tridentatus TaxID=6853 RepID=UPI003FCEF187